VEEKRRGKKKGGKTVRPQKLGKLLRRAVLHLVLLGVAYLVWGSFWLLELLGEAKAPPTGPKTTINSH
jgi:hypothetical protein